MATKIPYVEETINPFFGCTKVSEGCLNCYAEKMAFRCSHMDPDSKYCQVIGPDGKWNGKIGVDFKSAGKPYYWNKPKVIFVCSMGDFFHPRINGAHLMRVFDMIADCSHHFFLLFTKRPEEALALSRSLHFKDYFELPNIMIVVTTENQERANERIPLLLKIPYVKKAVSIEPMLGPIDFDLEVNPMAWEGYSVRNALSGQLKNPAKNSVCATPVEKLDWVIAGCESGNPRREMNKDWIRSLRDQCVWAEVPFYFKQKYVGRKKIKNPLLDGEAWQQYPEFLNKNLK